MSDYRFKVNLSGMIEILSDHLYSSPDVYIRELLQNAVDAVVARKKNSSPADLAGYEGNIDVYLEDNTLRFMSITKARQRRSPRALSNHKITVLSKSI